MSTFSWATAGLYSSAMIADVEGLIAAAREDGLVLRRLAMAESEIVFLKSVLEAYPGLGQLVAPRQKGPIAEVTIIGAAGQEADLDALLAEIAGGAP